jgi:hypothetical protein
VPFEGRNLTQASTAFKDHLNRLLSHTITHTPIIASVPRRQERAWLSFRHRGEPSTATVRTRFGPMELFLSQECDVIDGEREPVRLRTLSYRYTLTPLGADEPLFRWEFERFPEPGSYWCRHHVQGPIDLNVGRGTTISLNDLHLPTGWVPTEEVIRFLINDLGVPPLDTSVADDGVPGWHHRLQESVTSLPGE